MSESATLAPTLDRTVGTLNLVLFSIPDCPYCRVIREHHLLPMLKTRPPGLHAGEFMIRGQRVFADFDGQSIDEQAFARRYRATFSPTLVFLNPQGREVADRIVGLSDDFFGAYLEGRIAVGRAAIGRRG